MEVKKLECDICGGKLTMEAGGKIASCEYCGMQYSFERICEKVQEIKGTVNISGEVQVRQTGTSSDVQQWKKLLERYIEACDYQSALSIVRKILEAKPDDEEILNTYDLLREWQNYDVRDKLLIAYNGRADKLTIPRGVKKIEHNAFQCYKCEMVEFPETLIEIKDIPICEEIHIPKNVTKLEIDKSKYTGIKKLELPDALVLKLEELIWCDKLEKLTASEEKLNELITKLLKWNNEEKEAAIKKSPWYRGVIENRRKERVCLYCGSRFTGFFVERCSECGRRKNYY